MSSQQDGANANPPSKTPFTPIWPNGIAKIKRYLHERRAEREKESPQDRFGRRTSTATMWIAILAGVAAGIGVLQYCTFQKQLDVMQGQLDSMERDQAPYVSVSDKMSNPAFLPIDATFGKIVWDWHFGLHPVSKTPS